MIEGRAFLDVLEYLDALKSEASARTQIGRAYYAAFLESRSFAERHLGFARSHDTREHSTIPRLVASTDSEASDKLLFLRRLRNTADYDNELSAETVLEQLQWAKSNAAFIISRLDEASAVLLAHEGELSEPSNPDDA